jgi:hypothetical protein
MMLTAMKVLHAIDAGAELATAQELRVMIRDTLRLLPRLPVEDHRLACALLDKLRQLLHEGPMPDDLPPESPFHGEACLLEDAQACADALLDGLSGWLRSDVHPDAAPRPLAHHEDQSPTQGGATPVSAECAVPIGRLAVLAAAVISRKRLAPSCFADPLANKAGYSPPATARAPRPPAPGALLRWRPIACRHCRWTLWLPGCCEHAARA